MSWLMVTLTRSLPEVVGLLLACRLMVPAPAWAQASVAPDAGDGLYASAPPPITTQAQIVIFRPPSTSAITRTEPAHIYIDGKFHAALMPNGFTRFCVAPGRHTIESILDDAPTYSGKSQRGAHVDLRGGQTYFAGVQEGEGGHARAYSRAEAEARLEGTLAQRRVISRASAVVPCEAGIVVASLPPVVGVEVHFGFARSDAAAIDSAGQAALRDLVARLADDSSGVGQVLVRGHADRIGTEAVNRSLSAARARTVRQMLISAGLSARLITITAAGSSEPSVKCPGSGPSSSRIDCNTPNRRVEVRIAGSD